MRHIAILCTFASALLLPVASHSQSAQARAQAANADSDTMLREAAWTRLDNGVTGTKNTTTRVAALSALSLLGGQPRAEKLVRDALHDDDVDVRLAATVAAGEMMKKRAHGAFTDELRKQLNDDDPKIAFTTASTLWKLDDHTGEDILLAVAEGERSGDYNFWKGSKHNATRTLHSPSALAKIAAQQSLMILVPPVGMGMGAYGYLKSAGGVSPQVTAITQIKPEHTEAARKALIEATKTKSAGARVAAAEALSDYRGDDVRDALAALLTDSKDDVRFTACAAFLRQTSQTSARGVRRR